MAYREKTAWLTLVCMAVAYGIYFPMMALRETPPTLFDILWSFGIIAGTQAAVVIIGGIAAYYVLMAGAILVGVVMPFTEPPPKIVNTALLAIVIAEAVNHFLVLLSYRRGWHG